MGFLKRAAGSVKHGIYGYFHTFKESYVAAFVTEDIDKLAKSRKNVLYFNIVMNIASLMINGYFYTALMLMILKDEPIAVQNSYVGTIASIATACGMAQIFAPAFIEKLKTYKKFVLSCRAVYYAVNVIGLAAVPLLPLPTTAKINIFIVLVIIMSVAQSIHSPAICVWHLESLAEEKRADYFSIYQIVTPTINAVLGIVFSLLVDYFKNNNAELTGILILRGLAILVIGLEFRINSKVYESPKPQAEKLDFSKIFTTPLRHPEFLVLSLIAAIWTFACGIQGQYFSVYLLQDAKASYTFLQFISIFSVPCLVLMMPLWNKIIKKKGWLYALALSIALYSFPQLFNMLITEKTLWIYPVLCIYSNFVSPGLNLAFANLPYLRCPEEGKSSCLAFYSTVNSLAGLGGNLFGKYFVKLTEGKYLYLFGFTISNRLYHFFISFGLIALLAVFVFAVKKRDDRKTAQNAAAELPTQHIT